MSENLRYGAAWRMGPGRAQKAASIRVLRDLYGSCSPRRRVWHPWGKAMGRLGNGVCLRRAEEQVCV